MRKKPCNLKKPKLEYVYYASHDKRYAHVPKEERDEYPDVIILHDPDEGKIKFRRRHTSDEWDRHNDRTGWDEFRRVAGGAHAFDVIAFKHGIELNIFSKDVPMSKVIRDTHERRRRFAKPIAMPPRQENNKACA